MAQTESMTSELQRESFYLEPGFIYCVTRPAKVHTVVGSCVVVCLWDRRLRFGGMSHFLLPKATNRAEATSKYGNVATLELINMMERAGSKRGSMLAQILGGGAPAGLSAPSVGVENVQAARAVLRKKEIKIASEDVGGNMGRKIVFDTATGHVIVLKVHQLRESDWIATDC